MKLRERWQIALDLHLSLSNLMWFIALSATLALFCWANWSSLALEALVCLCRVASDKKIAVWPTDIPSQRLKTKPKAPRADNYHQQITCSSINLRRFRGFHWQIQTFLLVDNALKSWPSLNKAQAPPMPGYPMYGTVAPAPQAEDFWFVECRWLEKGNIDDIWWYLRIMYYCYFIVFIYIARILKVYLRYLVFR